MVFKGDTIVQVGREFYSLRKINSFSVDSGDKVDFHKLKRILENYDVRLLKEEVE